MENKKEIIILGLGPGWNLCPFDKETWAVAKIVTQTTKPKRVDKLFMMDDIENILSTTRRFYYTRTLLDFWLFVKQNPKILWKVITRKMKFSNSFVTKDQLIARINELKVPYITLEKHPNIPLSEEYPLKEVVEKFDICYFTNTICYMIAYALTQKVTRIDFYGVVQAGRIEYMNERCAVEFWCGLAAGLGVQVNFNTPPGFKGGIFTMPNDKLYGYKRSISRLKKMGKL